MTPDRRHDLRTLLHAHQPADERERGHRDATLRLLDVPGDPFARDHFEPGHVTASAFVLSPDAASLLLILHGKLHRWLQPGGHVDPTDDNVLAAAQREVAEEVGLDGLTPSPLVAGLLDVDVHVIPARKQDPEHRHFDVRFLFQARDWQFLAGSDAHAGRWVPLADISTLESDDSVLRAVAKLHKAIQKAAPRQQELRNRKGTSRLDRHLSQATGMPRSHALTHVRGGHVTVNGVLTRDTATHVHPEQDAILLNGEPVQAARHRVLVQHKPPGVVTSKEIGAAQTVMELIPEGLRHRDLSPVGRLDRDTSGLLILTTDGALNHRLTHPKRHVEKVYIADLSRELAPNAEERLARGIILDDGPTLPAKLGRLGPLKVRLTLREGRFHQVKRMMVALGSTVLQLHREQVGGLKLPDDLALGATRALTEAELALLLQAQD